MTCTLGGGPEQAHPWQDEAHAAAHGGMWRVPYAPRTALGLAALLGYTAARNQARRAARYPISGSRVSACSALHSSMVLPNVSARTSGMSEPMSTFITGSGLCQDPASG